MYKLLVEIIKKRASLVSMRGFTLIELLIVIAILGIIAVIAILALNPAEAQKRARDIQRLKDVATLQAALQQCTDTTGCVLPAAVNSAGSTTPSRACNNGWMGGTVGPPVDGTSNGWCDFLNILPVEPKNGAAVTSINANGSTTVARAAGGYWLSSSGSNYMICTYLESKTNGTKLSGDGKNDNVYEVFSDSTLAAGCPAPL